MATRVGILGGTFNPVHLGHLIQGFEVRWQMGLDEVWYIPAGSPPHKDNSGLLPFEVRLRWVREALGNEPGFRVLDLEGRRSGRSFTVTTLEQLREDYPTTSFILILGVDAAREFASWHRREEIVRHHDIAITSRPHRFLHGQGAVGLGKEEDGLPPCLTPVERWRPGKVWNPAEVGDRRRFLVEFPSLEVSSTLLRERVRKGQPLRHLVPVGLEVEVAKLGKECWQEPHEPDFID